MRCIQVYTCENISRGARGDEIINVIIDNLIIDVSEFIGYHPGGKFALKCLVGTDVSKFFFGGYSLEN